MAQLQTVGTMALAGVKLSVHCFTEKRHVDLLTCWVRHATEHVFVDKCSLLYLADTLCTTSVCDYITATASNKSVVVLRPRPAQSLDDSRECATSALF